MPQASNYDRFPFIPSGEAHECSAGWSAIAERLPRNGILCVECYPGADVPHIAAELVPRLPPAHVICTLDLFKSADELDKTFAPYLTDDPVFGHMSNITLDAYFDPAKLQMAKELIARESPESLIVIVGAGAVLLADHDRTLVYADMARWEIQLRYRSGKLGNLGLDNQAATFSEKYKCGFFLEWRVADRHKQLLLPDIDFLLDTNDALKPKMITGDAFRNTLAQLIHRPFRVVPYFDPGPWGGHWMEEVCNLPDDRPNYAWCFDCVPEENSLLLGFGDERIEIPAIDLVFSHPIGLLGEAVYACFGAEFPIRFDLLDTVGGGNLSLQVHPLTEYIRNNFGMQYTQDESYYLLDAAQDATVYLGLKEGIDRTQMESALRSAEQGETSFPAEKYVQQWPAKKHDHFLIPAGTIHCSGRNCMVLEISATPYIFTFKLWDWNRLGLDGRPRPIHLEHGLANIQWNRTTEWTRSNLVNQIAPAERSEEWRQEMTGLHELEFIETRRIWFTGKVPMATAGGVHVLNLVQGEEALVESETQAFAGFTLHYAETMIVPASVGTYTVRPAGKAEGTECALMLAYIRT